MTPSTRLPRTLQAPHCSYITATLPPTLQMILHCPLRYRCPCPRPTLQVPLPPAYITGAPAPGRVYTVHPRLQSSVHSGAGTGGDHRGRHLPGERHGEEDNWSDGPENSRTFLSLYFVVAFFLLFSPGLTRITTADLKRPT